MQLEKIKRHISIMYAKSIEDTINTMWKSCIDYNTMTYEVVDESSGIVVWSSTITIDFRNGIKLLTYHPIETNFIRGGSK